MHTHPLLGSKWWHMEPRLLLSVATVFHIPFHKCIIFHLANSWTCVEKQNLTTLLGGFSRTLLL